MNAAINAIFVAALAALGALVVSLIWEFFA
jgi:hypothetical protein